MYNNRRITLVFTRVASASAVPKLMVNASRNKEDHGAPSFGLEFFAAHDTHLHTARQRSPEDAPQLPAPQHRARVAGVQEAAVRLTLALGVGHVIAMEHVNVLCPTGTAGVRDRPWARIAAATPADQQC